MRHLKTLALIAAGYLLTACSASTGYADKSLSVRPQLQASDATLTKPCEKPVLIRSSKQRDVELAWGKDRAALVDCGKRHNALVGYYQTRDRELRGQEP